MPARQAARELAARLAFSGTDLTILATAVSEVARNIVRFTDGGEVRGGAGGGRRPRACRWWPGTPVRAYRTSTQAMADGYSTYGGLGIGLPGARRLMDEFAVVSQTGRGTTITMTMWCKEGQR